MGLGQPDVQREHARLGTEAEENAASGHIERSLVGAGRGQSVELCDFRGAQLMLHQKQAHQRHQTADHRHSQIGVGCPNGAGRLLLNDPGEGGEGHDFKEHEGGVEIRRQEHAQGGTQGEQIKEIVSAHVVVMPEIFRGEKSGLCPHQADDHDVHPAEPIHRQLQSGKQGKGNGDVRSKEGNHQGKGQRHQPGGHGGPLSLFSGNIDGKGHDHGEENK